ncbi:trimeric intracellular cation channel family protein [Roseibium sp.]|uniref:trimeric intracellular cation channel family protein n=1 Tax=Roseibium sp. TaxID=1936156 RepID=UPI003A96CA50
MLLQMLDYLGVAVFAIAGGIVASRKGLDFVAFLFFATLTGVGGGTLRDLLLGVPVFWVKSEGYLVVCLGVSIFMWFFAHVVEGFGKPLRWADAIGMSAYSVMGAAKALSVGDTSLVAVLMGVATATFGGVLRDVIAGEPSAIVKSEIYVTAAFVGAGGFVALKAFGLSGWVCAGIAGLLALMLRGGAIEFGWSMPGYKSGRSQS